MEPTRGFEANSIDKQHRTRQIPCLAAQSRHQRRFCKNRLVDGENTMANMPMFDQTVFAAIRDAEEKIEARLGCDLIFSSMVKFARRA
jgi:hypothetical protein